MRSIFYIIIMLASLYAYGGTRTTDSIRIAIVTADTSNAFMARYPGRYFYFKTLNNTYCVPYDWFTDEINNMPGANVKMYPMDSFTRPLVPYTK